jgi:ABC-type ATPase involved in cell division
MCHVSAVPAIARCIVHFTVVVLADEPQNVTGTLEAMRDEHLALAAGEALSGTGTHQ